MEMFYYLAWIAAGTITLGFGVACIRMSDRTAGWIFNALGISAILLGLAGLVG